MSSGNCRTAINPPLRPVERQLRDRRVLRAAIEICLAQPLPSGDLWPLQRDLERETRWEADQIQYLADVDPVRSRDSRARQRSLYLVVPGFVRADDVDRDQADAGVLRAQEQRTLADRHQSAPSSRTSVGNGASRSSTGTTWLTVQR